MVGSIPNQTSPSNETLGDKIRLEEFKVLRGEIELRASEQRAMERNVILLSASIYGFLLYPKGQNFDDADKPFLLLAWYLPSLFSLLALVRWTESVKMIGGLANYLKMVEQTTNGGGWETHLAAERDKGKFPLTSVWYFAFWLVTCIGTVIVAALRAPLFKGHETAMTVVLVVMITFAVFGVMRGQRP
jgi:hypothetical protein